MKNVQVKSTYLEKTITDFSHECLILGNLALPRPFSTPIHSTGSLLYAHNAYVGTYLSYVFLHGIELNSQLGLYSILSFLGESSSDIMELDHL